MVAQVLAPTQEHFYFTLPLSSIVVTCPQAGEVPRSSSLAHKYHFMYPRVFEVYHQMQLV